MNKYRNFFKNLKIAEKNTLWNMVGGGWNGILLVLVTPFYIKVVGIDGYGILGLWLMMLSLSNLFDMGIGSTLIREFAIFNSKEKRNTFYLNDVLKTFEIIYWIIAIFLCAILLFLSEPIGENILKSNSFSSAELIIIIKALFIAVSFQFPVTIYSSGLSGIQKQGLLNLIFVASNTSRHLLGLVILIIFSDLSIFFYFQILVSFLQMLITRITLAYNIDTGGPYNSTFKLSIIKKLWKFSIGISMTAIFALIIANIDRVAITALLTTEDMGYYTIAYSAAIILQMGIQPFYKSYYPRYSELHDNNDEQNLIKEYFKSCSMMSSVIFPIIMVGFFFAPQLFEIWLNDSYEISVLIFQFLLIGIGLSGLMWLPAALQHAYGWTSLHLKMLFLAIIIGSPLMIIIIKEYGVVGATTVWVVHGVIEIMVSPYLMHKKILTCKLKEWLVKIILKPFFITFTVTFIFSFLTPKDINSFFMLAWIGFTTIVILITMYWYNKNSYSENM